MRAGYALAEQTETGWVSPPSRQPQWLALFFFFFFFFFCLSLQLYLLPLPLSLPLFHSPTLPRLYLSWAAARAFKRYAHWQILQILRRAAAFVVVVTQKLTLTHVQNGYERGRYFMPLQRVAYRYICIYVSCSYYASEGHRRGRRTAAAAAAADSFVSQH